MPLPSRIFELWRLSIHCLAAYFVCAGLGCIVLYLGTSKVATGGSLEWLKTWWLNSLSSPGNTKFDIDNEYAVDYTRYLDVSNATWPDYSNLIEDKFTIALQTYDRPNELDYVLHNLLDHKIPSLFEVVVVWNNVGELPPANFVSAHGVKVRYRASLNNSLNEKLKPDPEFHTQALFLSDDDVFYHPEDLEFAFQTWRKFGQDRLVGGLARCASVNTHGQWVYSVCSNDDDEYSMILTNLSFVHISFLAYYSSSQPHMVRLRKMVDRQLNCEDIAMNFVISYLTNNGPLLVHGRQPYVNLDPIEGISKKPGHMEARSKCLNEFVQVFGFMPLVNESARVERGVFVRAV